jgi:hypothetical protein
MDIFQGNDNLFWLFAEICLSAVLIVGLWLLVLVGRDARPSRQKKGEEALERFGDLEEDRAPIPKFIILCMVLAGCFAVYYMFWIGRNGMGF